MRPLRATGLNSVTLHPKEGLSLLNGTQVSTALALIGAFEARQALDNRRHHRGSDHRGCLGLGPAV